MGGAGSPKFVWPSNYEGSSNLPMNREPEWRVSLIVARAFGRLHYSECIYVDLIYYVLSL